MVKKENLSVMAVVFMVFLTGVNVWAFEIVEPGYDVEVFSVYSNGGVQGLAFDHGGNLYASHRSNKCIWKITPDGNASEFVSGFDVRGLVFGGGTAFGNYLYTPDGQIYNSKIRKISLAGSVANFASFNPPKHNPSPIAIDTTGNYGGNMFSATSGQDRTYQVNPSGAVSLFADFPGWRDGGGPSDIIFDNTGNYDNSMIMTTGFTNSSGNEYMSGLWKIDPSGHAMRLIPETMYPAYMDIDEYGDFEGKLYVTTKHVANGPMLEIRSVEPDGSHHLFATTDASFRDIIFSSDGVMYVSEDGNGQTTIYKVYPIKRNLIGLEIEGLDAVAENSSTNYKAIAYYDTGNSKDVTASADWSVEPNTHCNIAAGLLLTERIDLPTDVAITAQYSESDINKIAEQNVSILAICPSGSALEFDGVDDYIDCGNDRSLDVTELTWSLWIKRAETTYSNERALISNTGPKTGPAEAEGTYALQIDEGGQYQDKIQFVRHKMPVEQCPLSNTAIKDTNWHHIAVTRYMAGDVIIYIDGYEDATGYLPERTAYGQTYIGTGHMSYSNFKGSIDEVVIYNRALPAEEIQTLMHSRPDIDDPNIVGYWGFDEGEGQVAGDSSVYGNDGQLGSTPDADSSDPVWVESDAPVGICSLEGIVERNLSDVWNTKVSILEQLYEAMAQEQALLDYMDEKFADRDFGDTSKGDVAKAKQKIHSAIQTEEQAQTAVNQSLDKLDDAMKTLGIE